MAVPKRKKSHSKTRMRRSKYQSNLPHLIPCPHCGQPRLSHRVCPECGFYGDRQVITLKEASKKE